MEKCIRCLIAGAMIFVAVMLLKSMVCDYHEQQGKTSCYILSYQYSRSNTTGSGCAILSVVPPITKERIESALIDIETNGTKINQFSVSKME